MTTVEAVEFPEEQAIEEAADRVAAKYAEQPWEVGQELLALSKRSRYGDSVVEKFVQALEERGIGIKERTAYDYLALARATEDRGRPQNVPATHALLIIQAIEDPDTRYEWFSRVAEQRAAGEGLSSRQLKDALKVGLEDGDSGVSTDNQEAEAPAESKASSIEESFVTSTILAPPPSAQTDRSEPRQATQPAPSYKAGITRLTQAKDWLKENPDALLKADKLDDLIRDVREMQELLANEEELLTREYERRSQAVLDNRRGEAAAIDTASAAQGASLREG